MSKRSRACEFSQKARDEIVKRDKGCIFCQMGYAVPEEDMVTTRMHQIMHFIPRSQGGLGIPENGAVGCIYHHLCLDNGADKREKMSRDFEEYLKNHYKDWDKEKLIYNKWR